MRTTFALTVCLLLLAGCGGGGEADPPEVAIGDATWSDDEIAVEVETNLPEGAILSWDAIDGDDPDDLDAATANGETTVEDGAATATADVAGFTEDSALVNVDFLAGYDEQPDDVQEAYGPPFTERDWPSDWKDDASDEVAVSRS